MDAVDETGQHMVMAADPDRVGWHSARARIHAVYDWSHPPMAILGVVLMEFGDYAMMRRMLRGIKTRAETISPDRAAKPADVGFT